MTQVTVTLSKDLDRVVGVVKSVYSLPSKDKAIQLIIDEMGHEIMEKELRPEFVKKLRGIEKTGKFKEYASVKKLMDEIEHA
ncbi:MAG: DUF2683 family protein [Candidatus Diapherotrites archaeon]|nr:DUF2683 family protein [Candidatus Diapherotrites archaeon]